MTLLLETIARAAADAAAPPPSYFPVVLNADDAFPKLKPEPENEDPSEASFVRRLSGWQIPEANAGAIESMHKFVKKLKWRLESPKSLGRDEFLGLLSSFSAEKMGSMIGGEIVGLIAEGCISLDLWEPLETLIIQGLVRRLGPTDIVEKLVEKNRSDVLCLCVRHVSDLRSSDLLLILRHFLSPSKNSYDSMLKVRKEWESQGLLAIEKATRKDIPEKVMILAKEASILLMMSHDGFSASELCLHHLFSSPNLDGLVLSFAISKLDGLEVLRLVCYLGKWLEKYQRLPKAVPCPSAGSVLGLRACSSVPSLESVIKGLWLVIDEHFSYLVLNSEFHEVMRSMERVTNSLASVADLCCSLANVVENLRFDVRCH